jgi:hypothetical protein
VASLAVLKIERIKNKRVLERDELPVESLQKDFVGSFGVDEIKQLGNAKTEIKKSYQEGDSFLYEVKMSSDTINKPIYIYDEGYREWITGYQEIDTFDVKIEVQTSRMYIFAPKPVTDVFTTRLKKAGYISFSKLFFNFSKIGELSNLESVWGLWEDSTGVIRRTAKFGKGINTVIKDYTNITTLDIDYRYQDELMQLTLMSEGRIYTNKNLTQKDLSFIYDDISKTLIV